MKPVATETAASTVDFIVEQMWSIIYAGRPVEDKPENLLKILAKYMMKIPNAFLTNRLHENKNNRLHEN